MAQHLGRRCAPVAFSCYELSKLLFYSLLHPYINRPTQVKKIFFLNLYMYYTRSFYLLQDLFTRFGN